MRRLAVLLFVAAAAAGCRMDASGSATGAATGSGSNAAAASRSGLFPSVDRPVAQIVSPEYASGGDRDAADENGQVVRLAGIHAGQTVADVGSGSGYHTLRLSRVVGPDGLVIAVDVVPEFLDRLRQTVRERRLENIEFVLGRPDDPRLPRNSIEVAVLAHMYHEVGQPYAFLWNLAPSIRANGVVVVIDQDRPFVNHGTPPAVMQCEFEAVGYRRTTFRVLQGGVGYAMVFAPPSRLPDPSEIRSCRGQPAGAPR